jgi:hypothetical protein
MIPTDSLSPAPVAPTPRRELARAFQLVAPVVFALALAGALFDREPFDTWFYCFAWWSYVLYVDGWVHRHRGESLLLSHPRRFAFFSLFSVGLWFIFEAFNFRLENWSYQGMPLSPAVRWAGYILGFATVVPALMETADLLETAGLVGEGHVKPLGWKREVEKPLVAAGATMLILSLALPRYFFPLVWGGFAFLLEPLNERLGAPSILADWREGRVGRLKLLLSSGFLCGILWEAWNVPAGAHWVYHLPMDHFLKVFAMPLPGYLGFPVFAVEAFVMTSTALVLWEKAGRWGRVLLTVAWAAFAVFMCRALDMFTVAGFS